MNYENLLKKYKTPFYLYDINELEKRIDYLKKVINKDYKIIYAVKANTFVIKEIDKYVDGYEICSFGEYEICNDLNINKDKYLISGVYKEESEIDSILSNGVKKFTVESVNQYDLLSHLTKKYKKNINVLIRLTSNNQFGVSEEDFRLVLDKNKNNEYINILGIEYFSGTQKHSTKRINREIDYINEFMSEIESEYDITFTDFEYGIGAPVYYFQGEEFDEDTYFKELNIALSRINKRISLEIGRSLVASCGYYFTSVVDKKKNKFGNSLILDGGMNHFVYYGQTMAMRIPHYDIFPNLDKNKEIYNLYGSLCTINDIIVKNVSVSAQVGTTFIFKNVGAYSATEGISLFLSRDLPKIVILNKNKETILVRDKLKTSGINFPKY